MSHFSASSDERDRRAASVEDLKDLPTCTPAQHKTTFPAKWNNETQDTSKIHEDNHHCPKSSSTGARHRYKTHSQLIKAKLDQIKAEMQKIHKVHLHQRPERKAYHPFVWSSLSPYRDTTEIDCLLTATADPGRRNHRSSVKAKSTQPSN